MDAHTILSLPGITAPFCLFDRLSGICLREWIPTGALKTYRSVITLQTDMFFYFDVLCFPIRGMRMIVSAESAFNNQIILFDA